MLLFIDSSEYNQTRFAVVDGKAKVVEKTIAFEHGKNFKLLGELNKFLKKNKVAVKSLKKVVACTGPGSFTGLRTSSALMKGLAFGLNVPLFGISKARVPASLENLLDMNLKTKIELEYNSPAYVDIKK